LVQIRSDRKTTETSKEVAMDATKNLRNKLKLVGTKNCFVEYALTVAIVHRRLNTHVHLDEMRKNDKTHARIEPHRVNCYSY